MAGAPLGNRNSAKGRKWSDALRKYAVQNDSYDKIAKVLIEMAEAGDMAAIKEFADRSDGKAHQSVDMTSSDGSMTTKGFNEFYARHANNPADTTDTKPGT